MNKLYLIKFNNQLLKKDIIVYNKCVNIKNYNYDLYLIETELGKSLNDLIDCFNFHRMDDDLDFLIKFEIHMLKEYKQILRDRKIKTLLNG